MSFLTLVPAYGSDYTSKKDVLAAWERDKDFVISDISHPDDGRYINRQDAKSGMVLNIRYKRLTQICQVKVK